MLISIDFHLCKTVVNASLNFGSIVGIILFICGGGLYFVRSFRPELARDYDIFFAAIGLLCGGIFFFQGWRLDPILQFGIFLLAGGSIFFGYESVRLRGVATNQARRSSYFDDDQVPNMPRNPSRSRWDDDYDQFEQPERLSRRFKSRDVEIEDNYEEDEFNSRRVSRAIPESAVSRRRPSARESRELDKDDLPRRSRFPVDRDNESQRNSFGDRRSARGSAKRGSRPLPNKKTSRKNEEELLNDSPAKNSNLPKNRSNVRSQSAKTKVEDASFVPKKDDLKKNRSPRRSPSSSNSNLNNQSGRYSVGTKKQKPRDNSSRFDD